MKKNNNPSKQIIEEALTKKALGYECSEVVEEYVLDDDGNLKLNKKKVTKKYVSPDTQAAKLLMDNLQQEIEIESLSDQQLKEEKVRLLKLLKKEGE